MALADTPDLLAELDALELQNPDAQVEAYLGEVVVNRPRASHGMLIARTIQHLAGQVDVKLDGYTLAVDVRVSIPGMAETWMVPDICVIPKSEVDASVVPLPRCMLLVEVASPSTRAIDLGFKLEIARTNRIEYAVLENGGDTVVHIPDDRRHRVFTFGGLTALF